METNLAGYLDRHYLPGSIKKAYYGYRDNEGLLSTIPAVGTTLLGVLASHWVLSDRGRWTKAAGLALSGLAIADRLFGGLGRLSGSFRPVVVPLGAVAIEWLLLLYLYRKRIFLRV
jgi:predicted acyltransferase